MAGKLLSRSNARDMPLPDAEALMVQRTRGTGAIDSVKDLVLEVPRLPLTYRSALSPISSPVARAAYLRPSTTDDNIASR